MSAADPIAPLSGIAAAQTNRARGELKADFVRVGLRTEPNRLFETGGYRLRIPRAHHAFCEAVMVNTGGGMAGGDHARFSFSAAAGSDVTVTSTAAEKIYRSDDVPTLVEVALDAAPAARLEWLPQETILFEGAKLSRKLDACVARDASLLISEMMVFGRLAMGEVMRRGSLHDQWRVRRGGALAFAEELRIEDDMTALLDRPALGAGARATGTVLLVSPDAESRLAAVREALASAPCMAGASAWNGMLVIRASSPSPELLRAAIVALLGTLRGRALPRLWA